MRLSEKSPLWQWNEVVIWLFKNGIINDQQVLGEALFYANINAALGELDKNAREMRHHLLERIAF